MAGMQTRTLYGNDGKLLSVNKAKFSTLITWWVDDWLRRAKKHDPTIELDITWSTYSNGQTYEKRRISKPSLLAEGALSTNSVADSVRAELARADTPLYSQPTSQTSARRWASRTPPLECCTRS